MKPANEFMGSTIRMLATKHPEFCDRSGQGFWPVPAYFPRLLSDYIDKLQCEITQQYLLGNSAQGNTLASVRTDVIKIISEGDLGENHTQLYIEDHPIVIGTDYRVLPFYNFCESALEIKNPIILLGFLMRNEEGSLEEAIALAETGLIGKGAFADKHLIEEKEHGRIAESVTKKLLAEPAYAEDFKTGMRIHDQLYISILGKAASFEPMMSASRQKFLREWDESVYRTLELIREPRDYHLLGVPIRVHYGVHAGLWTDTKLLGTAVSLSAQDGDRMLDFGTGTGIQGIIGARACREVVSIDFNEKAVECAKENVANNGVDEKVKVLYSNGFSNVEGKFDIIAINPPFRWFKPKDMLDAASNDENYQFLDTFFRQAHDYLNPHGKIELVFANTGDINYLTHLARSHGYQRKTLLEARPDEWRIYTVFEFTALK